MEIEVFFEEGMKVNARVGNHLVKTDQRTKGGGEDTAPEPFEYFLSSLATCAGVYVKIFCEKRGIDSSRVRLVQKHEVDQDTRRINKIHLEILLPDDFPPKYKDPIISAANQCSVKKVLAHPPDISVTSSIQK